MLYINDHVETLDWQAHLSELPAARQEKCLRYLKEESRRQCVAAWLLLRDALESQYGLKEAPEIAYMPDGKPYFPERPDIHFSLSHCSKAVACALGDRPVGVDVERIRTYDDEVAAYVLNDAELEHVRSADNPALEFTKIWTQKESCLKLTGEGLTRDLKEILTQYKVDFQITVELEKGYVCTEAVESVIIHKTKRI